jgi:hypothetical protein
MRFVSFHTSTTIGIGPGNPRCAVFINFDERINNRGHVFTVNSDPFIAQLFHVLVRIDDLPDLFAQAMKVPECYAAVHCLRRSRVWSATSPEAGPAARAAAA